MEVLDDWKHHAQWSVYGIVLEPNDNEFLIKIGFSKDPIKRVMAGLIYLPYEPSLIWTPKLPKATAREMEKHLHGCFHFYRTRGEWFKFSMEDKKKFNGHFADYWSRASNEPFKFNILGKARLKEECSKAAKNPSKRRLQRLAHS